MSFTSFSFFSIFLPISLILILICNNKIKKYLLLSISIIFYISMDVTTICFLLFFIILNFLLSYFLNINKNKVILSIGLLSNIFLLAIFKIQNFNINISNSILNLNTILKVNHIPLGISFITFMNIAFLVDIYREKKRIEYNIFDYANYIMFFPTVISGPIHRFVSFRSQLLEKNEIDYENIRRGIHRIIEGMAKKMILAGMLSKIVSNIYLQKKHGIDIPTYWIGSIAYTLQLYFDFSGYSDIAIGISQIIGIKILENFNYPYISQSITEFWRRWHMTLSSFFRDYLYIPLGGNRRGNTYVNLIIVFLVTGLWHGTSLNFVMWGIFHGIIILIEKLIHNKNWYNKVPSFVKWFVTIFLVNIFWIFFNSDGIEDAIYYVLSMFGFLPRSTDVIFSYKYFLNNQNIFIILISILLSFPLKQKIKEKMENFKYFELCVDIFTIALLVLSILFLINNSFSPFIYFQF